MCDGTLARDFNSDFLKTLDVSDSIQEGHQHLQARLQSPVKSSHALHNPCLLLRDEFNDLGVQRVVVVRLTVAPPCLLERSTRSQASLARTVFMGKVLRAFPIPPVQFV